MSFLIIALWLLPLLAWSAPALAGAAVSVWRDRSPAAGLFIVAALWLAFRAFPSSAEKGTPPDPPVQPPDIIDAAEGKIRLFYEEDGRLIPFYLPILEVK
jgi:hypothetical protein